MFFFSKILTRKINTSFPFVRLNPQLFFMHLAQYHDDGFEAGT
jgi:hypothetical protein